MFECTGRHTLVSLQVDGGIPGRSPDSRLTQRRHTKTDVDETVQVAHFSDRGHLFQADRGRRFRAIVDAQGMRASEGLNVSQS